MDSSAADSFFLRSTSAVSLHERFSQLPVDQLSGARRVTFDPVLRKGRGSQPVVLQVKRETSSLLQTRGSSAKGGQRLRRRRRSVWTRLGWQQVTRRLSASRPPGFWSFRDKYRWRARFTSTCRRRCDLRRLLCRRRLLLRRNLQKLSAGRTQLSLHLQRGGATAARGWGLSKDHLPTRKQLDKQLDDYMSMSKSRLDKQLDDYMSMSKSRLDAQLDDYMLMAGQTEEGGQPELRWD